MKYIAVTLKGIEDIASDEIKSSLNSKPKLLHACRILFNAKDLDKFSPRVISRVYSYITHFTFSSEKDILGKCSKIVFSFKGSFVVRCSREGSHDFDSRMIERDIGEIIYKQGFKVDLKKPDNTVLVDITGNTCFLGLLVKENLCKRRYRIKIFSSSINACLAASAVILSGVKKSGTILDPFCKDAVIPIEAYMLGYKNVYACDESMNNVRNAKINAKLASAKISFSKSNIDSLDLKFGQDSIDSIITFPPFLSKKKKQGSIENLYKEFFYQVCPLLTKAGTITVISHKPDLLELFAKRSGFKIVKEKKVFASNLEYKIIVFKRL